MQKSISAQVKFFKLYDDKFLLWFG
jgi:hypothetical protein